MYTVDDYEARAQQLLKRSDFDFFQGGAMDEITLRDNRMAYSRYKIRPRYMQGVGSISCSTTILGHQVAMPLGIAPTGLCDAVHPDGEMGIARAACHHGVVQTVSTYASHSIEDIAAAAPGARYIMQVCAFKDRSIITQIVRRAEQAGYIAIALTIDASVISRRLRDKKNGRALLKDQWFPNLGPANNTVQPSTHGFMLNADETWEDLSWIKSITKLPVIVKGVLTGEDARSAVLHGADAVWVSNHGGRQLDGAPATLDVLREVVAAVKSLAERRGRRSSSRRATPPCEVYLDGGIRRGSDILKAIALGAQAVFMGRPVLYGLACDGEQGVKSVIQILHDELINTMQLSGCRNMKEVRENETLVVHQSQL